MTSAACGYICICRGRLSCHTPSPSHLIVVEHVVTFWRTGSPSRMYVDKTRTLLSPPRSSGVKLRQRQLLHRRALEPTAASATGPGTGTAATRTSSRLGRATALLVAPPAATLGCGCAGWWSCTADAHGSACGGATPALLRLRLAAASTSLALPFLLPVPLVVGLARARALCTRKRGVEGE